MVDYCAVSLSPKLSVGLTGLASARTVMDLSNTVTLDLRAVLLFPQDPSRNHRAYRLTVAKLEPPIIPFMPLLIKGQGHFFLSQFIFNVTLR